MNSKKIGLCLVALFILGAAGCGGGSTETKLGRLVITTQINSDNTPVAELSIVVDNVPKLYVCAEIINARRGDEVRVAWRYTTKDRMLATEVFSGRRSTDRPREFITWSVPTTSWLASTLVLDDISWPAGEYEATVQLNQKEEQKIGFVIVTENDFDIATKKSWVKNLWLGSEINSENQITVPATQFSRTEDKIYAVALFQNVPAGTRIEGSWKLLETGEILSKFTTDFSGGGYFPFELALDQVGKTIWSKGNYTFTLFVDNLSVSTKNFSVG